MNAETTTETQEQERGRQKFRQGVVVSDKMSKTVVVAIERRVMHHKYGKVVRRTNKYLAHDEKEEANVGDTVEIVESRPLSRAKRWRMHKIVTRAV